MGHLATLYSKAYIDQLKLELADMRKRGLKDAAQETLVKYKRRFCDLSLYVKAVKERFSRLSQNKSTTPIIHTHQQNTQTACTKKL